jgi:precorrin-6x reductase
MLRAVGHPFAVNPDKALRRIAEESGWPILSFGRPVPLRHRLGLHTKVGKAAAVTVVASAVGAITVALVSRRKHRVPA